MERTKIGGKYVKNFRYEGIMVLIADSEGKLPDLVSKLDELCRKIGLKINIGKTETMGITKTSDRLPVNIMITGQPLKQVSSFR